MIKHSLLLYVLALIGLSAVAFIATTDKSRFRMDDREYMCQGRGWVIRVSERELRKDSSMVIGVHERGNAKVKVAMSRASILSCEEADG